MNGYFLDESSSKPIDYKYTCDYLIPRQLRNDGKINRLRFLAITQFLLNNQKKIKYVMQAVSLGSLGLNLAMTVSLSLL